MQDESDDAVDSEPRTRAASRSRSRNLEPEPEPESEPQPELEPAAPSEPEPEPAAHDEPEPAAHHEPEPEPEPAPELEPEPDPEPAAATPVVPQEWNIWNLEQLARGPSRDTGRDEERVYLLVYLRDFADPDGNLPSDFDALVRESFGDLIGAGGR